MSERIDHLIERLKAAAPDHSLVGLEDDLALGISQRSEQARMAGFVGRIGAAAVGFAMALGLTVGGMTAAATPTRHADAFAVAQALAPSTLIEGDR